MSVTTSTTKGVSFPIRKYARSGAKAPETGQISASVLNAAQRVLPIALPLALALFMLASWYLSTAYGHVNSLILPAPADVLASLINGLRSGLFLSSAVVTLQESLLGFLLAVLVGLPLGYGLAKSRLLAAVGHPYLAAGQAIPALVIAPLLVLWLGYGLLPIMVLCMLIVLFPMVITTILGVQTIDRDLADAARVEGASGWRLLASIEFPLALPAILAGIRTGLTLSITGAVVGEFVSGGASVSGGAQGQGLGVLVQLARYQYDTAFLFATLLVLATLAILYYGTSWVLIKLAQAIY
jgi:NitT/TauT family transport system permease protein